MKLFAAFLLCAGIACAGDSLAAAKTASLLCDTTRTPGNEKVQFSLVFNEAERSLLLNGSPFEERVFTPYRITGKNTVADAEIAGVSKELSVSLDRVTGKFALMSLPVATNGGEFTEYQKDQITSRKFDPLFTGSCELSKPKF